MVDDARYLPLLKWGSLATVIFQNSAMYLFAHASVRLPSDGGAAAPAYSGSVAVLCTELLKLLVSVLAGSCESSPCKLYRALRDSVRTDFAFVAAFAVPAACYNLHNNLWYVAIANLSPVTIAVAMQLKIVFTAFFARTMLGQRIGVVRMLAIALLVVGLSLLQGTGRGDAAPWQRVQSFRGPVSSSEARGLLAIVGVCFLSGFAGVLTERLLKDQSRPSSLWTRNVQMALFSTPLSAMAVLLADGPAVRLRGPFAGFNRWLLATIALGALGGLAVSFVFRFADNLLKAFAVGISIAVNAVLSVTIFGVTVSKEQAIGSTLVAIASVVYHVAPQAASDVSGDMMRRGRSEYEPVPTTFVHVTTKDQEPLVASDQELSIYNCAPATHPTSTARNDMCER